ncbi:unnamed protein product [Schistosoma turkestanicum]|nr:unnamed protein product [Schistosoma turkestanicum]
MPSKIRIVLEGYARYRDGKRWKKRYCVLSLSPTTPDALHLYITKSYDDFAAYRNSGSVLTAMLPAVRKLHELPISPESRALLGDAAAIIRRPSEHNHTLSLHQNTSTPSSSVTTFSGPLINTAAQSYNAASGSTSSGLAAASNLASSVGGPAPVDVITGFESGYHMDKESNIIVLIGGSSVYALALAGMDEMFCWADNLARIVVDNHFRVTLRHTGDGSKLFQGLQGSLHVQHWRLCLIGEPSTGCKFICNWRLDHVDKAYTMTMPAQSANQFLSNNNTNNNNSSIINTSSNSTTVSSNSTSGISNSFTTINPTSTSATCLSSSSFHTGHLSNLDSHRTGSTIMSAVTTSTSNSITVNNPNKHLFFMECSPASGKGRGSYIFEIDGSRLVELTIAIEQFTALRYNPNLKPATSAEASQLTATAQSNLSTNSFVTIDRCNNNNNNFLRNNNNPMCTIHTNIGGAGGGCSSSMTDDLGVASSSFSSDTSSNPRSVSPTHHHHHQHHPQPQQQQQQPLTKRRSRDSIFNPLRKISAGHHNFNLLFNKTNDYQSSTIDRFLSKQTMSSFHHMTSTAGAAMTTTTAAGTMTTSTIVTEQSLMPPVLHSKYSMNFQRTSSLSPPDMMMMMTTTTNDPPILLDHYNPNSLSRCDRLLLNQTNFKEKFDPSGGGGSAAAAAAATTRVTTITNNNNNNNMQEGNNSPIEILNSFKETSHNVMDFNNNNNNPLTSSICSCSSLCITTTGTNNTFPITSSSFRLVDDVNILSSSSSSSPMIGYDLIENASDDINNNIQVAKVAAGLIISRKPPHHQHHHHHTQQQQQHSAAASGGYSTRISALTSMNSMFTGTSTMNTITTTMNTCGGGVTSSHCKQAPQLPPLPPVLASSTISSCCHHHHQHQPHHHHHHHHTHHHRFIFDGGGAGSGGGNQSSSGCSTTAVLPSVPIPSIGTDSGINIHSIMHNSSSSCSSEYNRTQIYPESLLSKEKQYSRLYHNSSSNLVSSYHHISDSLHTSSSDLNCLAAATSSSMESTLDQVDKNICDTDEITSTATTTTTIITTTTTTTTTTSCITGSQNSPNHEIFTADEDYWDLRDHSNANSQHKSLIHSSKVTTTTTIDDVNTSKKSDHLCAITDTIPSTVVPELHSCKESSLHSCELNRLINTAAFIFPHSYLSLIGPGQCIYRHRLQQYRVCHCISSLRRSFSASSNIQFIGLSSNNLKFVNTSPSVTVKTMRSLDSCVVVPCTTAINDDNNSVLDTTTTTTTTPTTTIDHDSKHCRTLQSFCANPRISIPSPLYKSFCGGRLQKIHRLFHRKQPESHNNNNNNNNLQHEKIPMERSELLHDLDFDIQLKDDIKSKTFLYTNVPPFWHCNRHDDNHDDAYDEDHSDRNVDLFCRIFICPRHGILSLRWNLINDTGQQHISRLDTTTGKRKTIPSSKKLLKSIFICQKHSRLLTLPLHSVNNSTTLSRPLSCVRLTTERKSSENPNIHKDNNDGGNKCVVTSPIVYMTGSHTLPKNKISHSLSPSPTTRTSNIDQYYLASITHRSPSLTSLNSLPCSEPCLSKLNFIHSSSSSPSSSSTTSSSFCVEDYYNDLLEWRTNNNNNNTSLKSLNNSQQQQQQPYESLSTVPKSCHSEKKKMMTTTTTSDNDNSSALLLLSSSSSSSSDLKYHSIVNYRNTIEKSFINNPLWNYYYYYYYSNVELFNEIPFYLLRINSYNNQNNNNNLSGLVKSCPQRKHQQHADADDADTCTHDHVHHSGGGSNMDCDILQLSSLSSSLHSDKHTTPSLSSSSYSSEGLALQLPTTTTTKGNMMITWPRSLCTGNSVIDNTDNCELNYSTNSLSYNKNNKSANTTTTSSSSSSSSHTRQSYLSKLFDRSVYNNNNVKSSMSPSMFNSTIRANTLPATRIPPDQLINNTNTWNNVNNHHVYVNSLEIGIPNRNAVRHRSNHRNSIHCNMSEDYNTTNITSMSNDRLDYVLSRKCFYQSEIDPSSRMVTTEASSSSSSSSNNNNNNNANRQCREFNEQLDKSTLSIGDGREQQLPVNYPVYNNLINLRETARSLSNNDGVISSTSSSISSSSAHGLKSISSLQSSLPTTSTSISGNIQSDDLSLTSQFLHVTTINDDDGYHQSQSTASYVNLPMFWSNHRSTTTTTTTGTLSSVISRSSTSCQQQQYFTADQTTPITTTTTISPRLYANMMLFNTTSNKQQSVKNQQQQPSKTDFNLLCKNRFHYHHHPGAGAAAAGGDGTSTSSMIDCSSSSNSSSNLFIGAGESQLSKLIDVSNKPSYSFEPISPLINPISTNTNTTTTTATATSTLPQCCREAVARVRPAVNLPTSSDYSNLPDEVRDPSRNYAMVDLRPSPASSSIPPTELTLNMIQHHNHNNDHRTGQCTTGGSSSSSGSSSGSSGGYISLNNSTGTGSSSSSGDCTSDAATLTSDTVESYKTIGTSNDNNNNNNSCNSKLNKSKTKHSFGDNDGGDHNLLTGGSITSRRRHSHSLSLVNTTTTTTTDHPSILLNYIHVIAASNSCFASTLTTTTTTTTTAIDYTTQLSSSDIVNDSNRFIKKKKKENLICDFGNSPDSSKSSSGLGEVTSSSSSSCQSTESSLVVPPTSSISFGDLFSSCRSMTSSGTSSVESGSVNTTNTTNNNNSNIIIQNMIELSDENCVNYAQIDFARTMALGELSDDIIMTQENQMLHKLPSSTTTNTTGDKRFVNRWSNHITTSNSNSSSSSNNASKINRTTSVKKTLCRSIRLIGRGTRKKIG